MPDRNWAGWYGFDRLHSYYAVISSEEFYARTSRQLGLGRICIVTA